MNVVNQNGTAYIDNKEYTTLNGNTVLTAIKRIYNSEGFADTITATIPNYKYYRRDHLGNNRELWCANTKKTLQHTQYYPSGLPWPSNTGDNPGVQERKYNGKEFVEMHGLDTYDYGARGYFAAMGRFMTVDPLAERNYSISPYAYCSGNPINRIDPDGMDDVYSRDGKFIEHNDNEIDKKNDHIVIRDQNFVKQALIAGGLGDSKEVQAMPDVIDTQIESTLLSAKSYSNIFTDALSDMKDVNMSDLANGAVSVVVSPDDIKIDDTYNNPSLESGQHASGGIYDGKTFVTACIN